MMASALMSVVSFAQSFTAEWPKPLVPEFTNFAVEDTCYLWNVGAGGFYINHQSSRVAPYWATRSSVNDSIGTKVIFTQTNPGGTEEAGQFEVSPNAYLLVSYVTVFNQFRCTFYTAWDAIWTDNNTESGRYFDVVPNSNYIKIQPDAELPASAMPVTEGMYLGVRATDADMVVCINDGEHITEGDTFYDEWAAVSKEAYETWNTASKSEENKKVRAQYNAAKTLKIAILKAEAVGVATADLAECYAVYNNLNSTIEELEKAAAIAYDKGRWVEIEPIFGDIEEGEENDVSGVFTNPDFSSGDTNGWDITWKANTEGANSVGYQKAEYKNGDVVITQFIEAWKKDNKLSDGSITQTIAGLPAGKYMLAVDAIANAQWQNYQRPDNVQLFAKASLDGKEYQTPIATENNLPEHFEFTFVHTGGSMTLGVRAINSDNGTAKIPVSWIAMDNLKLYYYGAVSDDPDKVMLDELINQVLAAHPLEDLEDVVATVSIKEAFEQTVTDAQAATGDYEAWQDKVKQAQADLEEAVKAYEKFEAKSQQWEDYQSTNGPMFEGYDVPEWDDFADFVQNNEVENYPTPTIEEVLEENELTPAEIEEYITAVDSLYSLAFGKSLRPGMDCSSLLVNASFADGFTGWTHSTGTFGGLKAYPCVEVYDNKVEVYQVVKNVPDGVYTLECQAFERPTGNGGYNGTEPSKVFLYMNDYQTGVQNIMTDAMPEDEAEDKVNCFISGGDPDEEFYSTGGTTNKDYLSAEGYVPDGMSGASYAFRAGRYVQKVFGLVEGGTMKIGLTSNDVKAHWVLWSKFKLTYEGAGEGATAIMLKQNIATLEKYLEENAEDNMTVAAVEVAQKVVDDATGISEKGTGEEMIAAIEKVKEAQEAAQANVAAMKEFTEVYDQLVNARDDDDPNPAGMEAYDEIESDVDEGYQNMDTEELLALVAKMKEVIQLLNTPAYEDASDDTPVDFTKLIVNNSFENGLNGWEYYQGSDTKAADNFDVGYTIGNADGNYVFNTWDGSAPEGGFYVSQVLKSLPAGTYELQAILASDKGHVIDLTANGEGMPFETIDDKEYGLKASIIFKLEEKGDVTIKASSMSWFKADDFRLTYYGNESEKEVTGIEETEIANTANDNAPMYNLAGQQVGKDYKGIVIVNGKKLYIK